MPPPKVLGPPKPASSTSNPPARWGPLRSLQAAAFDQTPQTSPVSPPAPARLPGGHRPERWPRWRHCPLAASHPASPQSRSRAVGVQSGPSRRPRRHPPPPQPLALHSPMRHLVGEPLKIGQCELDPGVGRHHQNVGVGISHDSGGVSPLSVCRIEASKTRSGPFNRRFQWSRPRPLHLTADTPSSLLNIQEQK